MASISISQVAHATPFDNTGTTLVSTNVEDAIIELSALTPTLIASNVQFTPVNGLVSTNVQAAIAEVVTGGSFPYKRIPNGVTVTIPVDREMMVRQMLTVQGSIIVLGELVII